MLSVVGVPVISDPWETELGELFKPRQILGTLKMEISKPG